MSTGLEQNITNRETKIDEARIIVDDLNENIVVLNNKIESIGSKSDSEIREEIDNGLQIALATMNDDIENLRKREQEIRSNLNSTEVNELLRQVSSLEQSKEQKTSSIKLTSTKSIRSCLSSMRMNKHNYLMLF